MSIRKRGKKYWYRFRWKGELVEESTGQGNKEVARQMEAAHRTALAKGDVGIRGKKPVPTLAEFAEKFLPYVRSIFAAKTKTREYYENEFRTCSRSIGSPIRNLTAMRSLPGESRSTWRADKPPRASTAGT